MKTLVFLALAAACTFTSCHSTGNGIPKSEATSMLESKSRQAPQSSNGYNSPALPFREISPASIKFLRDPSINAKKRVVLGKQRFNKPESALGEGLEMLAIVYRQAVNSGDYGDHAGTTRLVSLQIGNAPARVPGIVAKEISMNPSCTCEIVKAAIINTGSNPEHVAAIVEAAIHAAPEHMRLAAQCGMAVAPEAVVAIQELLARLDPDGGASASSPVNRENATSAVVDTAGANSAFSSDSPCPLDPPGLSRLP